MKNAITLLAKGISIIFHPLLIPSIGFLLLFYSGFYFSMMNWEVKRFVLLIVFFTTCILPLLTIAFLSMNERFSSEMEKSTDRVLPLMFSAIYYYIGYYLLGRLPIFPVYKVFLISTILVIILLMVVSLRWKISNHMASIGGLTGALIALSLRLQINTSYILALVFLIAGLVGTSRLILKKHNPLQIYAGYALGFLVMFLILMFI
ncbi:MAG: hypothetical protein A2W90_05415 [Bacteroidetes bacterium GWF2_42_66]|nr:MAG: hypothetical protein A2W92_03590 [Bacteroidetes bacterium GWA2_42_15]OFX96011.1 MAG: hypothetical protein A2W89_02825 [Bacteroidetes bacterium GWE2_42_39]OFY46584.1 MAG: hypothetical protein A2W90_05415 [Bacteroidetes bacterium GWF2_42_66]HBL75553.1 hypothetical protein [Prolixibacteraceae bacterium]HCR91078.1 hypothetical protein [Prolixibacteraceae bacterium]